MKKIITSIFMCASSVMGFAKTVSPTTAQSVAYNFYKAKASVNGASALQLVYTANADVNGAQVPTFYIFNAPTPGFVIVSADDNVMPILGYSTESGYRTDKVNASVQYWLGNYSKQVAFVIQNNLSATAKTATQWSDLTTDQYAAHSASRTTSTTVGPLLPTTWDQENEDLTSTEYTYNADCPYDSSVAAPIGSASGETLTGCVATAMSQVMKYWNWPDTGRGSYTYTQSPNPDGIPAQTANFAIAYHFDSMTVATHCMPSLTRPDAYVARLMYNAGVSVAMDYGTNDEGGSGAYVTEASVGHTTPCAERALDSNWRYTCKGYLKHGFSTTNWTDSMFNEMNASRPVIYAGQGNAGGHCWVMDGYDNDSFFHFNWGWSGYCDGYYTLDDLAPSDPSSGSVGDTFNSQDEAIIHIVPDTPSSYSGDTTVHDTVRTGVATITAQNNQINIYPNPATSIINLTFGAVNVKSITITDIEGRTMQQWYNGAGANGASLSVDGLADGMYLVRLETEQGAITRKVVIAR